MSKPLWNNDDVERGAAAMARHYAAAPFLTSDLTTTRAVLDAVLPAYRKRLLNELADKIEDSPFPPVPASYMRTDWLAGYEKADALTVDMLRAKAREVEL